MKHITQIKIKLLPFQLLQFSMMINKEEYGKCCIDKQIIIIDLKKRLSNGQVSNNRMFEIVSKHKQVIQRVSEVDNRREKLRESLLNIKYSPLFFLLEEVAVVPHERLQVSGGFCLLFLLLKYAYKLKSSVCPIVFSAKKRIPPCGCDIYIIFYYSLNKCYTSTFALISISVYFK